MEDGLRTRVIFTLKNRGATVPFHHQDILFRKMYDLLQDNEEFRYFQFFNFSGLKGQTKVSKEGLHYYSSKITLVISSISRAFIDYCLNQLFSQKEFKIANLILVPESVEKEEMPVLGKQTKYVCISPMILLHPEKNYAKKFISPNLDDFSDYLYESTLQRMEKSTLYPKEELASFYKFQLVPDQNYLKRIRQDEKKFARIYTIQNEDDLFQEIRGYTLPFTLYAERPVQEFAWKCGIGSYTHHGYGMLDIADPNQEKITSTYYF